ncbi:hypothetical protein N7462_006549 [Penicillium macrosclerotiorum]|uniref:uncharacterized protein n=1 Tax=Penicillium macrosclerotiorum TaxID=303699 RepID=UPI0025499DB9|nr:uncharacterized protein N7462_006549 [Penicillium macrosclerotiorum]KAJ5683384.1 hypothetical protein N7462_006549 [Penicillium macrosclerotiorum]
MAPIPETLYTLLWTRKATTLDATLTEKMAVLVVFSHVLALYTLVCWLGARKTIVRSFWLTVSFIQADGIDPRKPRHVLERQFAKLPQLEEAASARRPDVVSSPDLQV